MSSGFDAFYKEFETKINELNEKEPNVRRDRRIVLKLKEELAKKEQDFLGLKQKINTLNQKINLIRIKQMMGQGDLTDGSIAEEKEKLALYQEETRILSLRMQDNRDSLEKAKRKINEVDQLERKIIDTVSRLKEQKENIIESLDKIEKVAGKKIVLPSYKKEGETIEISNRHAHEYNALLEDLKGINKALDFYNHSKVEEEPTITIEWDIVEKMSLKQKMKYFDDLGSKITNAPLSKDTVTIESLGCTINAKDKKDFRICLQEYQKASNLYKKEILDKQTVTIDWKIVNGLSNKEKADYFASLLQKIKNAPKENLSKVKEVKIGPLVEKINVFDEEMFYKCFYEFNKAKEAYLNEIIKPSYNVDWNAVNNMSLNKKIKYLGNTIYLLIKKTEITEPTLIEIGDDEKNIFKATINKYDEELFKRCCKEYFLAIEQKKEKNKRNSGGIDWSEVKDLNSQEKVEFYEEKIYDIIDKPSNGETSEIIFKGYTHEINTEDLSEIQAAIKAYGTSHLMLEAERTIAKRKKAAKEEYGQVDEDPIEVIDNDEQNFISVLEIKKNFCLEIIDIICKRPIKNRAVYDYNGKKYEFDIKYKWLFDKVIKYYQDTKNPKVKDSSDKDNIKRKGSIIAAAAVVGIILPAFLLVTSRNDKVHAAEKKEDSAIETCNYDYDIQNSSAKEKKIVATPEGYVKQETTFDNEINKDTKEVLLETDNIVVTLDPTIQEGITLDENPEEKDLGNPEEEKDLVNSDEDTKEVLLETDNIIVTVNPTIQEGITLDENPEEEKDLGNPEEEKDLVNLDEDTKEVLLETDNIIVTVDPIIQEDIITGEKPDEVVDLKTKMENILLIHNYTRPDEVILNVAVDAPYDMCVEGYHLTYNNKTYSDMDECRLTKTAHAIWREAAPGSYESALEVASDIANRLEDGRFDYAKDPYDIISHSGQYSVWEGYNIENSNITLEEIPDYVLDAVIDCFYKGKRNNDYVYFKASDCSGPGKTQIVLGGNNHHGLAADLARFDYEYEDSYVPRM